MKLVGNYSWNLRPGKVVNKYISEPQLDENKLVEVANSFFEEVSKLLDKAGLKMELKIVNDDEENTGR